MRVLDTPFHRKPIPAVAIAVGLGILSSRANATAAKAVGVPALLFSALFALLFAAFGA
ncbi:MAG: hypothetical protein ACRDNK_18040 [Solirubrobacteraceae bacterium]